MLSEKQFTAMQYLYMGNEYPLYTERGVDVTVKASRYATCTTTTAARQRTKNQASNQPRRTTCG